jgi:vacuolar-type H+-ATPase subunit E/Vma4
LREVVERILADGQVTPDELKELHKAVEAVLPMELRRQVATARKEIADAEKEAARSAKHAERAEARRERERNRPAATANFMVAGVRHEGRPAIIERYANTGDAVTLVRDRRNKFSANAIAVQLMNGKQIGFVPEDDSERISPLLDQGHRADAVIVKILGGGRSLIPVVQAYIMRPDADARVSPTVRRTEREASEAGSDAEAIGHRLGKAASKIGLPVVVAVGIGLLVLLVLVSVLTGK